MVTLYAENFSSFLMINFSFLVEEELVSFPFFLILTLWLLVSEGAIELFGILKKTSEEIMKRDAHNKLIDLKDIITLQTHEKWKYRCAHII
ncbi:hypothetical protein [Veronia nyctiphanis]|uniref:hypothetical protein n=1 Tax=Veronia nyctiphanis TaxID=1278244 RepID=UPI0013762BA3|nr:hypothetical protein [Veronia nyctiphanis]